MSVEIYATLGDPHEIAATLSDLRYLVFQGMKGDTGDSAYEEAVSLGFVGTEAEWIASLKGDPGFSPEIRSFDIQGGHRVDLYNETGYESFNVMDGEDGADGVSPTVQTEAITGGHRVTITDKAHPHGQSFDVMDGEDEGAVRFDETQTLTDEQKNTACRNIGALGQLEYDAIQQSLSALDADISLKADEADIPTKVSDLQNDTGFVTAQQAATAAPVQSVNGRTGAVTVNEVPDASGASVGQVLSKTANGLGWTTPSGGGGAASLIINLYYHSSTDSYTTSASPTQLYNALPNCALAAAEHTIPVTDYKKDGANYVTAVFVDPAYENEKLSAIVWTLTAATSSSTVTVTREEVAVDGVPDSTSATVGQVLTKTQYGTSWAENIPQSAASLRLMYDGLFAPSDPDLYLTSNLGIETAEGIQNALHYGTIGSAEFVDVSTSTDHVVYDLYRSSVENGVASVVFTHEEADCIRTVTMTGNTKSVPTFGTIPLTGGTSANAVLYTPQTLTAAQKEQARTNIGAGTYSKPSGGIPASDLASAVQTSLGKADSAYQKPSGGIPASDLASGVIPSVPQMATAADMSDWTSGKTVDASLLKTGFQSAGQSLALLLSEVSDLDDNKADKTELPDASTSTPVMDGTAAVGTSTDYARADHVHPSDTTRLAVNQGAANAGKFMVVGNDGDVVPVTMTAWQGGSY